VTVRRFVYSLVLVTVLTMACRSSEQRDEAVASPTASITARKAVDPCDQHAKLPDGTRWACSTTGSPVDLLSSNNGILYVFHRPVRVVQVSPSGNDPETIGQAPANLHYPVCTLEGPAAGVVGYVKGEHLQRARCGAL
jgi:hypothetical protein